MSNEMGKGIGIGIAAGVLIGLAVGYLTSPKSGEENREWIRERAGQFREKAKEMKARMRKKSDSHEEEDLEEVGA